MSSADFIARFTEAAQQYDPDGSKARRIAESLEDPNNPNRPEFNHNPLEVQEGEVLVLEDFHDHTTRFAYRVLGITRGWDHKLHLGLGCAESILRVLSFHLTVLDDGKTGILEILPPDNRNHLPGIYETVRVARILLG